MAILVCAFCMPSMAQHLKFMGIPLNGTITEFQQKLAAKGVVHDKAASAMVDKGTRLFKGRFAGSDATIVVWYDTNTKYVRSAKAFITCYSKNSRDNKYAELKSMLLEKYDNMPFKTETEDDLETLYITVTDDSGLMVIGIIKLYRMKVDFSYDEHTVHVEYSDFINSSKHQKSKMDDL